MSHACEVIATAPVPAQSGRHQARPNALQSGIHGWAVSASGGDHRGSQANTAEAVIADLISQYFRCSSNMSGTFLCW